MFDSYQSEVVVVKLEELSIDVKRRVHIQLREFIQFIDDHQNAERSKQLHDAWRYAA